jgi:hypothetical protein
VEWSARAAARARPAEGGKGGVSEVVAAADRGPRQAAEARRETTREGRMRGNALLKVVNPLLLLALLVLAVTRLGMMLFEREAVHEVHEAVGIALVVLAAAHAILKWPRFGAAYRRRT